MAKIELYLKHLPDSEDSIHERFQAMEMVLSINPEQLDIRTPTGYASMRALARAFYRFCRPMDRRTDSHINFLIRPEVVLTCECNYMPTNYLHLAMLHHEALRPAYRDACPLVLMGLCARMVSIRQEIDLYSEEQYRETIIGNILDMVRVHFGDSMFDDIVKQWHPHSENHRLRMHAHKIKALDITERTREIVYEEVKNNARKVMADPSNPMTVN